MYSIRAPDHLGDGVMALAAIRGVAALGPAEVHAPVWGRALYAGLVVREVDAPPRGEVGVLFKPSFRAAWRWRHLPRRAGLSVNGRGLLLTDPVAEPSGHRREGYAAVVRILGGDPGDAGFHLRGEAPDLPAGHVGLNPWSPTVTVRWPHFRALADAQHRPVVFYAGPGEGDAVRALAGPHRVVEGLSLPDFAAALDRCAVFVSNDSGAAHFAAACGTRVVVVHGSTDAALTGVGEAVDGGSLWCRPCYRKWCFNSLKCLDRVPVDAVQARCGVPR